MVVLMLVVMTIDDYHGYDYDDDGGAHDKADEADYADKARSLRFFGHWVPILCPKP